MLVGGAPTLHKTLVQRRSSLRSTLPIGIAAFGLCLSFLIQNSGSPSTKTNNLDHRGGVLKELDRAAWVTARWPTSWPMATSQQPMHAAIGSNFISLVSSMS
ncbi:hypothetical protein RND71_015272 [Anisodus tanguticus]|uniref:Uncharacterized protein n=1 Tax=Anisodus tanguticus TaxID=243964 RepID=A0AAE1S3Z4_9SOLA|nr:hypothetical protein RND71_015272 [Anisodus tanguticus]